MKSGSSLQKEEVAENAKHLQILSVMANRFMVAISAS